MVSKGLNVMRIDERSGYLVAVEEKSSSEYMENAFSTKYRGGGIRKGKFHNQSFHNQNKNRQNLQGNVFPSIGRGRSPSRFRGRGVAGGREVYQRKRPQYYYCKKFSHLERDCYEKMRDNGRKGANTIVE